MKLVPLVNSKIAGKWMFIPLKMVLIGIDPYPHWENAKQHPRESEAVLYAFVLRRVSIFPAVPWVAGTRDVALETPGVVKTTSRRRSC
jgi:hypothetical protein